MRERFYNREEAGKLLARELDRYANRNDVLILALPRGGVPVAFEVACEINAPLDVYIVRKLGLPQQPELAMGAIASGGVQVLNERIIEAAQIPEDIVADVVAREYRELKRREYAYRGERPMPAFAGKKVILIDDGIATGATIHAAIQAIKPQHPAQLIVASPVIPPDTYFELVRQVDEVVAVLYPENFQGVGQWYENFEQTTDDEVREYLKRAEHCLQSQNAKKGLRP